MEHLVKLAVEAGRRVGERVDQDAHVGLPAGVDLALVHVPPESPEIVDLEVPEEPVAVEEDLVVRGTRGLELGQHLRPDVRVTLAVCRLGAGQEAHDESDSLHRSLRKARGPGNGSAGASLTAEESRLE